MAMTVDAGKPRQAGVTQAYIGNLRSCFMRCFHVLSASSLPSWRSSV